MSSTAGERERPSVLFVDDDESVCRSMCRCLERTGLRVTVTHSAAGALELLERSRFDVIVTDHQMPKMTGAELVMALIAKDPTLASRIVITSGDLQAEVIDRLMKANSCRGLAKPYTPADLNLVVKAAAAASGNNALTAA